MGKKNDYRYKIDCLIKLAYITNEEDFRNECIAKAKQMLDDIQEYYDCVSIFLSKYFDEGRNYYTKRLDVFKVYDSIREKEGWPFLTRHTLYERIRGQGIGERKGRYDWGFCLRKKDSEDE